MHLEKNRSQPAASSLTPSSDRDHLAAPLGADPDGDEHARVLRASALRALVPHAVHERVRVFALQGVPASFFYFPVDFLELVGKRLRGHPPAPRQLAGVVHATRAHSRRIHLQPDTSP